MLAVQQKLIGFGYYVAGGADGHFGPGTTAALRVFQQQNGLNPTGVVTENTARYLGLAGGVRRRGRRQHRSLAAPASAAGRGADVGRRAAPRRDRRGGPPAPARHPRHRLVLSGGADGMFGPSTERAVKLVQRVNGLPETGVVDAATARSSA